MNPTNFRLNPSPSSAIYQRMNFRACAVLLISLLTVSFASAQTDYSGGSVTLTVGGGGYTTIDSPSSLTLSGDGSFAPGFILPGALYISDPTFLSYFVEEYPNDLSPYGLSVFLYDGNDYQPLTWEETSGWTIQAVPEPSTWLLAIFAGVSVLFVRKLRRNQS